MIRKLFISLSILIFILPLSKESKKLVIIQTLWKHGEYLPIPTYPNDPLNLKSLKTSSRSLTENGKYQHFTQGQKLRKRYIEELKFLSNRYNIHEIEVMSEDENICLQSSYANFCGLYLRGNRTFLNMNNGLPCNMLTVSIKTDPNYFDKMWEERKNCSLLDELRYQRMKGLLPSLEDKYKSFLQYLSFHSGIKNLTTTDMVHLYRIINIQKQLGIKQKSWLTNETFEQMKNLTNLIYTIYDGEEGFNIDRDKKIIKLNGGPLLKIIMNNFDDILLNDITYFQRKNDSYFKANSFKQKLYFSFSVYDTTILSILRLIRATDIILKDNSVFPDFAAVLIFELWRKDILNYEIALMYSKNSDSPLENVTRFVKGCGGGDYCNFEIFKFLIKDLIPIDISKECKTDSSH